jgi:hypothetical protein
MRKIAFTTLAAMGAMALPAAAQAQSNEDPKVEAYVGASAGIHDLGSGLPNDDGGIYGIVAGVDVPVGKTFFVGAEGNYHIGDGRIDNEYGIAARAGVRVGETGKIFVRGGYQSASMIPMATTSSVPASNSASATARSASAPGSIRSPSIRPVPPWACSTPSKA